MKKCDLPPNLCNRCGKSLDVLDLNAKFGFDCLIGYGSKYDMKRIKASLCIDCFDTMVDQIVKEFKISPLAGDCTFSPQLFEEVEEDVYEEIIKSEA